MRTTALALTAVVVLLTACGGSDDEATPDGSSSDEATEGSVDSGDANEPDDPPVGDASTYSAELEDGTTLTVRLAVDESDPVIAPFAAFREQAGASDPIVWIVGSLSVPADFDESSGPATGRFLTFVPPGGEVISDSNPTSRFACGELDGWFGAPTGDEATALNDAYISIVDTSCGNQTLGVLADVGATTDYAMVVDGNELPEFERLYAGLLTELIAVG